MIPNFWQSFMRDIPYRKTLQKATRYQRYKESPKAKYANAARNKLGRHWIIPYVIIISDLYGNMHEAASNYKKRARQKEIENLEEETVSLNRSLTRWTFALALFSILTFFVSLGTLGVLKGQLTEMHTGGEDTHTLALNAKNQSGYAKAATDTARDTYIAENRAFIGPTGASLQPLVKGQGVKESIQWKNTGRDPVKVGESIVTRVYDDKTQWNAFGASITDVINSREACMREDIAPTAFAFPNSGFSQYTLIFDTSMEGVTNPFVVDQDQIDGKKVIAIMGCMTYNTIGVVRHTAFCFFYKSKMTPDVSSLNLCPNGWDAD